MSSISEKNLVEIIVDNESENRQNYVVTRKDDVWYLYILHGNKITNAELLTVVVAVPKAEFAYVLWALWNSVIYSKSPWFTGSKEQRIESWQWLLRLSKRQTKITFAGKTYIIQANRKHTPDNGIFKNWYSADIYDYNPGQEGLYTFQDDNLVLEGDSLYSDWLLALVAGKQDLESFLQAEAEWQHNQELRSVLDVGKV